MTGSTQSDIAGIRSSCERIGNQYGVDPRVVLAMIMQESHGYVGVRTTYSWEGIPTAGLMQCWGCQGYPGRTGLSQVSLSQDPFFPPFLPYPTPAPPNLFPRKYLPTYPLPD